MTWPTPADYMAAVQNPRNCFRGHADLSTGIVVSSSWGLPKAISGNFAVVFEARCNGRRFAVRCFTRTVIDQQQRYELLSRHLAGLWLPTMVDFVYLPEGVRVDGRWYPLVKMAWIEGYPLHQYVERSLTDPQALWQLARQWRGVVAGLRGAYMAHGDLQHGNVLVDGQGKIYLVDYDGMFVPALRGNPPEEIGHRNYQHPQRTSQDYNEKADHLSALVIYLSLLAVAADPQLWADFHTGENLILSEADFKAPGQTSVWDRLKSDVDPGVKRLAKALEDYCYRSVSEVPDLETALADSPTLSTFAERISAKPPALSGELNKEVRGQMQQSLRAARPNLAAFLRKTFSIGRRASGIALVASLVAVAFVPFLPQLANPDALVTIWLAGLGLNALSGLLVEFGQTLSRTPRRSPDEARAHLASAVQEALAGRPEVRRDVAALLERLDLGHLVHETLSDDQADQAWFILTFLAETRDYKQEFQHVIQELNSVGYGVDQVLRMSQSILEHQAGDRTLLQDIAANVAQLRETSVQGRVQEAGAANRHITDYLRQVHAYCNELPYIGLPGRRNQYPLLTRLYVPRRLQPEAMYLSDRMSSEVAARMAFGEVPSVLVQHKHLVVLGEAGMGKSTLLRYTVDLATQGRGSEIGMAERCLPLIVRLGRLVRYSGSMMKRIRGYIADEMGTETPSDFFETWPKMFGADGWLLALDSLDEINDVEERQKVVRWIENLDGPIARVIVTSRPAGYEAAAFRNQEFACYLLMPLAPEQIKEYAFRWLQGIHGGEERSGSVGQSVVSLLRQVEQRQVGDLLRNPLFLAITLIVWESEQKLPPRLVDLFDQFTEVMLEEAERRNLKSALTTAGLGRARAEKIVLRANTLLSRMALAAQRAGTADEAILISEIADALNLRRTTRDELMNIARRCLNVLAAHSGILSRHGPTHKPVYEFIHPLVRQYLAARAWIETHQDDGEALSAEFQPHLLDDYWAEVIALTLAQVSPECVDLLARHLLQANREDPDRQRPVFRLATALDYGAFASAPIRAQVIDRLRQLASERKVEDGRQKATIGQALLALTRLEGEADHQSCEHKFNQNR